MRVSGPGFYPIRVLEGCCKENVSVLQEGSVGV